MAGHRIVLLVFVLVTVLVSAAHAAPAGTVVVAQGVDPTTLDPQNHQETPAANVVANIFDGLLERDQNLKLVPLLRSGNVLSNYYNPDLDGMVDEAQRTMDPKRRLELYQRLNRLWVETAAAVPPYQQLDLYGVARRLDWKARGDERIKGYDMALRDEEGAR